MMETNSTDFEVEGKEGTWHGREIETDVQDGTQMVDAGTGRKLVFRIFEFKKNRKIQKELLAKGIVPNNNQLFGFHWPHIKTLLWGDGLVENRDIPPHVIMYKTGYKIVVICEARTNKMGIKSDVAEKASTLQDIFSKKI